MHYFCSHGVKALLTGLCLFLLSACGGRPFDYHPGTEIPNKPGVFSKEADGLVIYDSKRKKAETASDEVQDVGDRTSPGQADQQDLDQEKLQDFKEFQEYQEWKEWKKSKKDSHEYREFLEWREWKSFQEWKKKTNPSE